MTKPKLRVSSSVIGFKERAEKTWKLEEWEGIDDPNKEIVFFGLYHERDFAVFELPFKKRMVFWCGSDILRVMSDYERRRILKNYPETEHYCENEVEQKNLKDVGFESKVIPSFLDDVSKYDIISFVPPTQWENGLKVQSPCHIWMCSHPKRDDEYGIELAKRMAKIFPKDLVFHIYGVDKSEYDESPDNVIFHGLVEEDKFNEEIKKYHCGFRPNFHDGNSEVVMKSIFLGQYPITRIKYDDIWNYESEEELIKLFKKLKEQTEPNLKGRCAWIKRINQFPFCKREYYEPEK